jgi:hypothetical protein
MAVPSLFNELSTDPDSNGGLVSDATAISQVDNHLRTIYAMLAAINTNSGLGWAGAYETSANPDTTSYINRAGLNAPTASLPMGGFKHTGAADGSASGEYATFDQLGVIVQNSQSADYTLVAADKGKHIFHPSADTTGRTWTIPANASVAFAIGTAVTFINQNGAGDITIAITSDTMRLAGAGTTGSRTLADNGVATAIKVTSTEWIISGTGLT